MTRLPRLAIFGLIFSLLLLTVGCVLAINSCATENESGSLNDASGFNKTENKTSVIHYDYLDAVKIPTGISEQIKDYEGFKVSFNKDNHTPNYVAWELLGSEISNVTERSNNFWQDPDIDGCPAHRDYTYSGFDRGHMCPAADQKWSEQAMNDCFVMANMCPQDHNLNANAWATLENKERQWAQRDSAIIIIAGPIYYGENQKRIGDIGVRVPDAFFKAFLAPYVENPRAIAFIYPNMPSPGNMKDYALSIDELEEVVGYDFFYVLPDSVENKVESNYSFTEWNLSK